MPSKNSMPFGFWLRWTVFNGTGLLIMMFLGWLAAVPVGIVTILPFYPFFTGDSRGVVGVLFTGLSSVGYLIALITYGVIVSLGYGLLQQRLLGIMGWSIQTVRGGFWFGGLGFALLLLNALCQPQPFNFEVKWSITETGALISNLIFAAAFALITASYQSRLLLNPQPRNGWIIRSTLGILAWMLVIILALNKVQFPQFPSLTFTVYYLLYESAPLLWLSAVGGMLIYGLFTAPLAWRVRQIAPEVSLAVPTQTKSVES